MKTWLLAATAAIALAAPVQAADIPVKARPAPAPVFSWIGCYVGINGGWMGSRGHARTELSGAFLLPGNLFASPPARGSLDRDLDDFGSTGTVGGTLGCNLMQYGTWLFGVESDFNWAGRRTVTAA